MRKSTFFSQEWLVGLLRASGVVCLPILILSAILIGVFCGSVTAQKVFSVEYPNQADIKVFVAEYENQADLKVFKAEYPNQAGENDGTWFFTQYCNQADKKIFLVQYPNQADLKIFFVKRKNQAGWITKEKMYLLY